MPKKVNAAVTFIASNAQVAEIKHRGELLLGIGQELVAKKQRA